MFWRDCLALTAHCWPCAHFPGTPGPPRAHVLVPPGTLAYPMAVVLIPGPPHGRVLIPRTPGPVLDPSPPLAVCLFPWDPGPPLAVVLSFPGAAFPPPPRPLPCLGRVKPPKPGSCAGPLAAERPLKLGRLAPEQPGV